MYIQQYKGELGVSEDVGIGDCSKGYEITLNFVGGHVYYMYMYVCKRERPGMKLFSRYYMYYAYSSVNRELGVSENVGR